MNDLQPPGSTALDPWNDAFGRLLRPWHPDAQTAPAIRLDVTEEPSAYVVKADIPGVRKQDIEVHVNGSTVSIGAEVKRDSKETQDGRVLRSERHVGYTSRSFTLACEVDESRADARYSDGVLTLRLPKKTETRKRRLEIG